MSTIWRNFKTCFYTKGHRNLPVTFFLHSMLLLYSRFCTTTPINKPIISNVLYHLYIYIFSCGAATQRGSWPPHSWGILDHTQRCTTVGRTPLDEWSARRRDLYLTTHNTHNRQTSKPPVGFEPTISAGERPQTYALDRAATGTGISFIYVIFMTQINQARRCNSFTSLFTSRLCVAQHVSGAFPPIIRSVQLH